MPPPQHSAGSPPPQPDALPTADEAGGVCPEGQTGAFSGGLPLYECSEPGSSQVSNSWGVS